MCVRFAAALFFVRRRHVFDVEVPTRLVTIRVHCWCAVHAALYHPLNIQHSAPEYCEDEAHDRKGAPKNEENLDSISGVLLVTDGA